MNIQFSAAYQPQVNPSAAVQFARIVDASPEEALAVLTDFYNTQYQHASVVSGVSKQIQVGDTVYTQQISEHFSSHEGLYGSYIAVYEDIIEVLSKNGIKYSTEDSELRALFIAKRDELNAQLVAGHTSSDNSDSIDF